MTAVILAIVIIVIGLIVLSMTGALSQTPPAS